MIRRISQRLSSKLPNDGDRWSRFDPQNPPYAYFPNRSRAKTNQMTGLAAVFIIGSSLVGLQLYWGRNETLGKYIQEHKNEFTTPGEDRAERNHRESMRLLEQRSRRMALGLNNKGIGRVEIRDDDSDLDD